MKQTKKGVRDIALDILESVEKNQSYSNLLLNNLIKKHQLSPVDSGLLTEISYGTIQRKMTLDYFLSPYIKQPKKTQSWVINLLRLSVYQMVYLDKVPDHAIIFEAVEISKNADIKGHLRWSMACFATSREMVFLPLMPSKMILNGSPSK